MASTSTTEVSFLCAENHFPSVISGKINIAEFLRASTNLVAFVEKLGAVFAPVKYDMQGNIDKIKRIYVYDENSCLLELMLAESTKGKPIAAEGVLWLNRALLFFEIAFKETSNLLQSINYHDVNMKHVFTVAYEGSVRKYHNWVTQKIFAFICKMSPTLPQILKSIDMENKVKEFETNLTGFITPLHLVRCKIDDFFEENNLFDEPMPI